VNDLVDFARTQGYRRDELIGMIEHAPWPRAGTGKPQHDPRARGLRGRRSTPGATARLGR
jgi:hypothetical protein